MNKIKLLKLFSWSLVLIWMFIIFIFSSMNEIESNKKSISTINYIIDTTEKLDNKDAENNYQDNIKEYQKLQLIYQLNYPLRKFAHIFIYFILAILLLIALKNTTIIKYSSILTCIICFIYASTDEYHQTFINGRTGQVRDVLIDMCGTILGIIIYKLVKKNKK